MALEEFVEQPEFKDEYKRGIRLYHTPLATKRCKVCRQYYAPFWSLWSLIEGVCTFCHEDAIELKEVHHD